ITPAYGNINLILFWMEDETNGAYGFTYNGVHSKNYGIFVNDITDPESSDTDITTYDPNRADGSLVVAQTIKSKTVDVSFIVDGDTIEEAKAKLQLIGQWLASIRNDYNYPTLNDLIFDIKPDRKYQVLLDQKIDADPNCASLDCKATFLIPSGMAISAEPIPTGATGTNNGISKARPVITVLTDGSSSIVLNDAVSEQQITINHTITSGTLLTIDCENQTITDANGTDYISYVSLDTVWFAFAPSADYSIYITGGTIQNVEYYESY
ncbi:MAG: phage tail family protein, partial [Methanobacterium paludis]|nr:phage tail family protein [Methanobacterium paludis]